MADVYVLADDYTEFCLQDYDNNRVFIYDFVFNDKLLSNLFNNVDLPTPL